MLSVAAPLHQALEVQVVKNRTFSKQCQVCVYMKAHPDFKMAIQNSSYFNHHGTESPPDVLRRYDAPFNIRAFYLHAGRHQKKDMEARRMRLAILGQSGLPKPNIQGVPIDIIKSAPVDGEFRLGLDEFIKAGRKKLDMGEMPINAANYLQAIKIKVDDESKNKDRGAKVFETMFKGADGAQ